MRWKFFVQAAIVVFAFPSILPASCATPKKATPQVVANGDSPSLVIGSKGHLHVVFEATPDGASSPDIYATSSLDHGQSWSKPVDISNTTEVSAQPAITVEKSGAIDIAWRDDKGEGNSPDIYFARSIDGGKTFSASVNVSKTPGSSSEPALTVASDDSLHLVWCDTSKGEKNKDIYYSCSKDHGKTWGTDTSAPVDISNTPGASSEPAIVVDADDKVHVVWLDSTSGKARPDIFYSSKDHDKWSEVVDLSDTSRISSHPSIACGPDKRIYLVWSDTSAELHLADVWCMVGQNGKFEKQQNVSNTAGVSTQPFITGDNTGRVVIVWSDTNINDSKPEIFARVSRDKLAKLSHITDVSNTPGSSKHAQVALSQDRYYVVWEEDEGQAGTKVMMSSILF